MEFSGKVILVTGASAGIGEATALLFSGYSAKLSLVGRNAINLNKVADDCFKSKGIKPLTIVADLSKDEDVKRVAEETIKHFGRIDVLVNNAGALFPESVLSPNLENFDKTMNINLRSVYSLTTLLTPHLIKTKGNIINISSVLATVVAFGSPAYNTSKAALDHFTRLAALELAPKGVRVNSVNPGITITSFFETNFKLDLSQSNSMIKRAEVKGIPLGAAAESVEVAHMIAYLASDLAKSVTGARFVIDGGVSLTHPNIDLSQ